MSTPLRSTRSKLASSAALGAVAVSAMVGLARGVTSSAATSGVPAHAAAASSLLGSSQNRTVHHLKSKSSANWAGPVLTGSYYNSVATTFVVPQASCSQSNKFMIASFWAGLDGAANTSDTVEQAGVNVACYRGRDSYQAWTEEYPAPSVPIDTRRFSLVPGDTVRVSVATGETADVYGLDDLTTGAHFGISAPSPRGAEGTSAECIAEAPTGPHGLELLADFGSASFGGCEATLAGAGKVTHCQLISGAGCPAGSTVTLNNIQGRVFRFIPVHKASVASGTGGAFTVTWHHD